MTAGPEISFVLPVFDKAWALRHVVRALAAQDLGAEAEYIFVDDASTDGSAPLLETEGPQLPGFRLIANETNAGPAIRLNQGAAAARGRYLCLLDADEIIAPDGVGLMHRLADSEGADMVHGKVARSDQAVGEIDPASVGAAPEMAVSDAPLDAILKGRGIVRMAWLVEAELFRAAGGCDERIFIQDESLPLRLAAKARRFVDVRAAVTFAAADGGHLSVNRAQQHHDRFLTYYHFLAENADLAPRTRRALARKCLSAAWKAARAGILCDGRAMILGRYLAAGLDLFAPPDAALARIAAAFAEVPGIRRSEDEEA